MFVMGLATRHEPIATLRQAPYRGFEEAESTKDPQD